MRWGGVGGDLSGTEDSQGGYSRGSPVGANTMIDPE